MFDKIELIRDKETLDQVLKNNGNHFKYCMVLIAEKCNFDKELLKDILLESSTQFFGGIFPQIIYQKHNYEDGLILAFSNANFHITKVDDITKEFEIDSGDSNFSFVFVDGLAAGKGEFISGVYDMMGELSYLGGGCGKLTLVQEPVIFDNSGFSQNSAIIVHTKVDNRVSVSHGFENTGTTFFVNDAEGNVIKSLDFEPAFERYKKVLKESFDVEITDDNVFDVAKRYPLGLTMMDGSVIVRDPLFIGDNGEIICAGDVPINSIISLLYGEKEKLLSASKSLADENLTFFRKICKKEPTNTIVIDCISRVLFLEDAFNEEIDEIAKCFEGITTPFGALTIGEIANDGNRFLQFYNKTSVIGSF